MDEDKPASSPKKLRFTPKPTSTRRLRKAVAPSPKTNEPKAKDDVEMAETGSLLRRLNEKLKRQRPKVEKQSSVQVSFGAGATSSTSTRTFSGSKDGNTVESSKKEDLLSLVPCVDDATAVSGPIEKEYKEPWDYSSTYYPTSLPLRRPYSGDPELLDEAEFGEGATASAYDERFINPAMELGLLDDSENVKMIFFQFPSNLPLVKRSASAKGKGMASSSVSSSHAGASAREKGKERAGSSVAWTDTGVSGNGCNLEELSEGYMGKMLVYKSGAVKLKLGEVLYDVSPGSNCSFPQDLVAINTNEKHCCFLGDPDKKAVVSPDIDFLLDKAINLD